MRLGRGFRRFSAAEEGASAVEFAIVSLPLFLLAFGTLEFGRFLWVRNALQETALMAARCMGVLSPGCVAGGSFSSAQTKAYALNLAGSWYVPLTASNVAVNNAATCSGVSSFSQVTISYTFQTAVPILLGSLRNGVPVNAVACFPNQS
jgi:Flp pilus assembly protein TadG